MRASPEVPRSRWIRCLLATTIVVGCDPLESPATPNIEPQLARTANAGRDGILLAGNFSAGGDANGILRFSAFDGGLIDAMAPTGSGGLGVTCCMTFGPDENLYVTDPLNARVLRYHGVTGAFLDEFVPPGSGGLAVPLVPVFGPDGNLYVGDFLINNQILRFNGATGAFIDVFVAPKSAGMTGEDPQLFVFGPDGDLFVASQATHRILRFDANNGSFLGDFVPAGSGGLVGPSGLTFGPDGHLYVGSTGTNTVLRYDGSTGAFIDVFVSGGSGGLNVPVGLLFGPDGNLYVASSHGAAPSGGEILRYDGRSGAFIDAFVPTGTGGISGPRVIAFKMKTVVCHVRGGQIQRRRSLSIGYLSASDHLAHGDELGTCD